MLQFHENWNPCLILIATRNRSRCLMKNSRAIPGTGICHASITSNKSEHEFLQVELVGGERDRGWEV